MAPYVTALCFTYFLVSYFSAKYNMVYVVKPYVRESHLTKMVIHCTIMALILYQLVMTSVLVLKGIPAAISLLGLVAISIAFSVYNEMKWSKPFMHMPMDQTEESHQGPTSSSADTKRFTMLFHHPALTPPDSDDNFSVTILNSPIATHSRYRGSKRPKNESSLGIRARFKKSRDVSNNIPTQLLAESPSQTTEGEWETGSIPDDEFVYESASSDDELFAREDLHSEVLKANTESGIDWAELQKDV